MNKELQQQLRKENVYINQSYEKIDKTPMPMTDSRENLDEGLFVCNLEMVKCIIWIVKLIKSNEKVSALLDSFNEANLISWVYKAQ